MQVQMIGKCLVSPFLTFAFLGCCRKTSDLFKFQTLNPLEILRIILRIYQLSRNATKKLY